MARLDPAHSRLAPGMLMACCVGLAFGMLLGCGDDAGGASSAEAGSGASAGSGAGAGGGGGLVLVGAGGSSAGGNGAGGSGGCESQLTAVVRDFRQEHPDFEYVVQVDPGIVEVDLGADKRPVYAGDPVTPTTNGQEFFDQWYRDVPDVNTAITVELPLTETAPGMYTFDDSDFFPIDGQGFGDEGNPHNYHFTLELHTVFTYQGGEVFTFTGDDDLFTFINGKLAIDLGGVHGAMSETIDLDAQAAELGIEVGEEYTLDFFFAERHTVESNFRIDTTIECLTSLPPPT